MKTLLEKLSQNNPNVPPLKNPNVPPQKNPSVPPKFVNPNNPVPPTALPKAPKDTTTTIPSPKQTKVDPNFNKAAHVFNKLAQALSLKRNNANVAESTQAGGWQNWKIPENSRIGDHILSARSKNEVLKIPHTTGAQFNTTDPAGAAVANMVLGRAKERPYRVPRHVQTAYDTTRGGQNEKLDAAYYATKRNM